MKNEFELTNTILFHYTTSPISRICAGREQESVVARVEEGQRAIAAVLRVVLATLASRLVNDIANSLAFRVKFIIDDM